MVIGPVREGRKDGRGLPAARGDPRGLVVLEVDGRGDELCRFLLRGELIGTGWTDLLRAMLEGCLANDRVRQVRLDLSGLEFMDSYGVATLLAVREEALRRGKPMLIERPSGQVWEKLKVTGVLRAFRNAS
jgi:anti-anti-sigma factor